MIEIVREFDIAREIGERLGRAIAVQTLGNGTEQEIQDTPWDGIYPLDPDLDDELERVGILPGTEEFAQAEAAAEKAYHDRMEQGWD
jgi:hypothetical protein